MIDISDIDKAALLAALYNNPLQSRRGLGRDMTVDEARAIIHNGSASMGFIDHPGGLSCDYVCGRPIKSDLGGNTIHDGGAAIVPAGWSLYEMWVGDLEEVVARVRTAR